VIAAPPLGDTRDASPHLTDLLRTADVIAAEDTRRLRALARRLDVKITGQVVSLHEHNERARAQALVERARTELVVLVSDAGMPLVSDPGHVLVTLALQAGIDLSVAPGPSAVIVGLVLSGLPSHRFTFEGFLPKARAARDQALAALAAEPRTMVFFESPRRLAATLAAMAQAFGAARPAAVCRELTKTHQEVRRGPLTDLAAWAEAGVLGEVTLVVGGAADAGPHPRQEAEAAALAQVSERIRAGVRLSEAVAQAAGEHGVPRGRLYARALEVREADVRELETGSSDARSPDAPGGQDPS
jgi:16S rRNA (cytidine1402-2'-O)-methyltransferase